MIGDNTISSGADFQDISVQAARINSGHTVHSGNIGIGNLSGFYNEEHELLETCSQALMVGEKWISEKTIDNDKYKILAYFFTADTIDYGNSTFSITGASKDALEGCGVESVYIDGYLFSLDVTLSDFVVASDVCSIYHVTGNTCGDNLYCFFIGLKDYECDELECYPGGDYIVKFRFTIKQTNGLSGTLPSASVGTMTYTITKN